MGRAAAAPGDLLRRRPLFDAGLVAQGRLHRLHQAEERLLRDRRDKPDGSGERILTEGFHNEGPTWAPNGLDVMFFRDPGGGAGSKISRSDIRARRIRRADPGRASDPAWGPLLG